jgi:ferritin-like metal-binding protein YciE
MATATKKAASKKNAPATSTVKKKAAANTRTMPGSGEEKKTPFEKLFEDLLKDTYGAEQQLVEALQQMHEAATTDELKNAFEDHLYVTKKHVSRLERVFSLIGIEAEAKTCEAMAGLIKESQRVVEETEEGSMTRDAGLIIAAQKVEHYEIAAYGSLVQVALTLGHDQAATILERTLSEEEDTDSLLTEIAETEVNPMADNEENEEGEDAADETPEETETEG